MLLTFSGKCLSRGTVLGCEHRIHRRMFLTDWSEKFTNNHVEVIVSSSGCVPPAPVCTKEQILVLVFHRCSTGISSTLLRLCWEKPNLTPVISEELDKLNRLKILTQATRNYKDMSCLIAPKVKCPHGGLCFLIGQIWYPWTLTDFVL